jgi:hypothetical protein
MSLSNESSALDLDSLSDLEPLVTATPDVSYEGLVREIIPLEKADLEMLDLQGPARSQSGIQHLRAFHHIIALKLAAGERPRDVCLSLSITPQTISKLNKDEQFQQLIELYRGEVVQKVVDSFELMGLVTAESLMALHERLVGDERDSLPVEGLRRIAETFADRTGHSPIRRSETMSRVSHELTSESVRRIKALHSENSAYTPETIEAEVISTREAESQSEGAALSIADAFKPVAEDEADRQESRGSDV